MDYKNLKSSTPSPYTQEDVTKFYNARREWGFSQMTSMRLAYHHFNMKTRELEAMCESVNIDWAEMLQYLEM